MNRKQLFLTSIFFCCFLLMQLLWADPLPDLGDPSQVTLPPVMEKKLGKEFMQQLRASGWVIEDPIDAQYINALGNRLVTAAQVNNQSFFFFFMDDPVVNSFAGPGGYIAINTGLLLATDTESQLAAVMAHEIAHITQGHLARKLADKSHLKYSALAGMLAAVALGHVSGQAAEGAIAATVAGSQQSMLNFSREYEEEADRVGMTTLENAGFDPQSMPDFFQHLGHLEQFSLQPLALLSDHPLTTERIADAENRAAQYPKHSYNKSSEEYYLIKERLRVQTAEDVHAILDYYQTALYKQAIQPMPAALKYGYALALQANLEYQKAYDAFSALAQADPNELLYTLGMADVLVDENKADQAVTLLQPAYAAYPDNYSLMIQYTYTLMKAGQSKKALSIMDKYHLENPSFPVPYALLSDIQAKAGELALAYQTRATYLVQMGAPKAALAQLNVALKLPHNDADTLSRIRAQIAEIQTEQ
ncbi:MAG: M48 family metalloprotease [Gammaproteobacteria bacterium]|nr:M48 family metalloprotease [Gammaproteobacteria bacterium]